MLKSPLQFEAEELLNKLNDAITAGDRAKALDLTDKLELFLSAHLPASDSQWRDYQFTRRELRIIEALASNKGRIVSLDQLMKACYFDHIDDWPPDKIISIFIWKVRTKLFTRNQFHIDNYFGHGYILKDGPAEQKAKAA